MSNEKTVRVGQMPGRIEEYVVEVGTSISALLALAGLSATGFDVKVDGNKVTDLDGTFVTESTSLVILAKQVKGNAEVTVRVGQMPGRIEEYVIDSESSIADLLSLAGLSATGFDVKADGNKVTDFSQPVGETKLVILAKQVKGNAEVTVRVGQMPGRIEEYVVDSGATIAELLHLAGLSPAGFDVKVDGTKVTDFSQPVGEAKLVILAKQVKGNK